MPSNTYTPPSSTSSNGASPNDTGRIVRRRNRIPLSCGPCRNRKLKCNRGHPCDNCTKRGETSACNYVAPKNRKPSAANGAGQTPDDMQNRIDKLEGMVLALITNGQQSGGVAAARSAINNSRSESISTSSDMRLDVDGADVIHEEGEDDSEVERVSKGLGVMKVDGNKSMYASEQHWYSILAEIKEVKQYFAAHKDDMQRQYQKVQAGATPASSFLFQGVPAKDKAEILAQFPPKEETDRLISRYFTSYDPAVHVIHGPSFQRQYSEHMADPEKSPIAFVGMCFAMMTLSLQSYMRAGDQPEDVKGREQALSTEYRRLAAQCLIMSDLTQPMPLILETLILYIQGEYGRSKDAEAGVLLMTALCVRLAMRMGYHRDPGPHAGISIFQAETRRRVWAFVRKTDLLISFQFGMPAMIRSDMCDTQLPINVYDDELTEGMTEKAIPRPDWIPTPMTYMIAKCKITYIFGRILERVQSLTGQPSYEEIMQFDRDLRAERERHPALLQMRSFQDGDRDVANIIMQRIGLELVFLRSLFVLHRKYIAQGRADPRFAYSRRTCIDASMEMLSHQVTMHEEAKPGGRLFQLKWYISSLTTHDFLLAAGLVCLDLYHISQASLRAQRHGSQPQSPNDEALYDGQRKEDMLALVEKCLVIWDGQRDVSMEAYKASTILRILVGKIKNVFAGVSRPRVPAISNVEPNAAYGVLPGGQVTFGRMEDSEQSAAMSLTQLSGMSPGSGFALGMPTKPSYPAGMANLLNNVPERTGLTPNYTGDLSGGFNGGASPFTGFDPNLMGADMNFDWNNFETYLEGNGALEGDAMFSMNIDGQSLQDMQQAQLDQFGDAGVFMGAGTPGGELRM